MNSRQRRTYGRRLSRSGIYSQIRSRKAIPSYQEKPVFTMEVFQQIIKEVSTQESKNNLVVIAGHTAKEQFIESALKNGLPIELINAAIRTNGDGTYTIATNPLVHMKQHYSAYNEDKRNTIDKISRKQQAIDNFTETNNNYYKALEKNKREHDKEAQLQRPKHLGENNPNNQ